MISSPVFIALISLAVCVLLAKQAGIVLALLVLAAWLIVIVWILYQAQLLPESIMDILDRLTNKAVLTEMLEKKERKLKIFGAEDLVEHVKKRVVGQERVIRLIADTITTRIAQNKRIKPLATILLSGPTGTGKTEMAKAIAEFMFGADDAMLRIDVGSLSKSDISTLIGSPKGYAGSDSWGKLTSHLRVNPNTVILFDELEKAGNDPTRPLYQTLLAMTDEGRVIEQSDQSKVSATNAVIIMTSNANSEELGKIAKQHGHDEHELTVAVKNCLQSFLAPELLARIDIVTTLDELTLMDRARICALRMETLINSYGLECEELEPDVLIEAIERSEKLKTYGVRELIRSLERSIGKKLIAAKNASASAVSLKLDAEGEIGVEVVRMEGL